MFVLLIFADHHCLNFLFINIACQLNHLTRSMKGISEKPSFQYCHHQCIYEY